jgi:hypothetical protein
MKTYRIIRVYYPGKEPKKFRRTIKTGLTLEEAQKHCSDPSTRKEGVYFDGYTEE